jgi:hypothetical protein
MPVRVEHEPQHGTKRWGGALAIGARMPARGPRGGFVDSPMADRAVATSAALDQDSN